MFDEMPRSGAQEPRATSMIAHLAGAELSYPSANGEVAVLRGVDMHISEGEIVAVTGPSGSGKSSLIAMLAGLETPTGGRVDVLDLDLADASEAERTLLRRRDIGIVFQSFHLVPAMTALQNTALPLMLGDDVDAEKKAAAILERVGLDHRLHHRPSALSGGEQQRVAIARAFAPEPRFILADEPTGNLDQETGDAVVDIMFDLVHNTGASLLLVTHDTALAERCDRIIRIDAGRIQS